MQSHLDGVLFKDSFGTPEMRETFSTEQFVETFLKIEAALARAEADVGLVPSDAADHITECASLEYIDLSRVEAKVADISLFTMAIIEAWQEQLGKDGEYVHWGATSQDISDTAMVLLVREGYERLLADFWTVRDYLAEIAGEHAATPMIGRTHHVHATPITFGLKVATWIDELDRHIARLEAAADRLFVVQFFGATGTLSSLGEDGLAVQAALANELDLDVPATPWFAARDRFAELLQVLAGATKTLSKIASQVLILNRPAIGELGEPIPEGEIGSSTMPHKRNPMRSETTVALATLVASHARVMTDMLEGYDERDYSTWLVEFAIIPETFLYAHRAVESVITVLADLEVNTDAMAENLRLNGELVTSEAVMMRLAEEVGRGRAHEIVYEDAMAAIEGDQSFAAKLKADEQVTEYLSSAEIEKLTMPEDYTGVADKIVSALLDVEN